MSKRTTWEVYYHLGWTVRFRRPMITPAVEHALFPFIVTRASAMGVYVHALDGWVDHIHLVVSIPPELSIAYVVQQLKGASGHHLNQLELCDESFRWQTGYYVSTISPRNLPIAVAYVKKQKEHHTQKTTFPALEPDDDETPPDQPFSLREDSAEYLLFPRTEVRGEDELAREFSATEEQTPNAEQFTHTHFHPALQCGDTQDEDELAREFSATEEQTPNAEQFTPTHFHPALQCGDTPATKEQTPNAEQFTHPHFHPALQCGDTPAREEQTLNAEQFTHTHFHPALQCGDTPATKEQTPKAEQFTHTHFHPALQCGDTEGLQYVIQISEQ